MLPELRAQATVTIMLKSLPGILIATTLKTQQGMLLSRMQKMMPRRRRAATMAHSKIKQVLPRMQEILKMMTHEMRKTPSKMRLAVLQVLGMMRLHGTQQALTPLTEMEPE